MVTLAFAAWAVTVLGGVTLAFSWISHGGMRQERQLQDASVRDGGQYPRTGECPLEWWDLRAEPGAPGTTPSSSRPLTGL